MASYEYSYSSSSGSAGNALNAGNAGYSVEYSSGGFTDLAEAAASRGGLSVGFSSGGASYGSSSSGAVLVGSSGASSSGAVLVGSSGASASSNQTVNQIANDLLSLSGGASHAVSLGGASHASFDASAFSAVEQAILKATNPVEFNETETLTINGHTGLWINREEVQRWRGVIPITQYIINEDSNPEIIRKRTEQELIYQQEVAIRYLRPPTPPPPGEILIKQEANIATPPAPPLVIRQQPPRPETPAPLVVREAPPRPPAAVGSKVITISGKRLPPPPRKVIIERLAPLPSKPQSIMIERWLPYSQAKRRVIFQKNQVADFVHPKPRNVIIQWEAPQVQIRQEFKDLGIIRANPVEYVQRYGASLKTHLELPSYVKEIKAPQGVVLAAEWTAPSLYELEGDVQALNLIDLEREGLAEYRAWLARFGSSGSASFGSSGSASFGSSASFSASGSSGLNSVLLELFQSVDRNASGRISRSEAEKLLLRLNSRLGRSYGENEANIFFKSLDVNSDGLIDFEEFRNALTRQFA